MAMSPNEKAARTIVRALDSLSLNLRTVANFCIEELGEIGQRALFDFAVRVIEQFSLDPLNGHVTIDRADRYRVSNAMIDAVKEEGYHLT